MHRRLGIRLTVVFTVLTAGLAAAQLGPVDGRDLPPADLERIQTGAPAPDFTLLTSKGKPLALSELRGRNVVLVFYRGYW